MSHITTPHPPTLSASCGLHKRLAKSSAAVVARLLALLSGAALLRIITLLGALAILVAGAALAPGCIIVDGTSPGSSLSSGSSPGSGSSMDMPTPSGHRLPQPTIWRVEQPVLDVDAQKRLFEVEQYLWDQYQAAGWQIMATTQTYIGDIYDWMDPASVKGSQEEPPPKPTPEEMQLPDGVLLQKTELDAFSELRGPAGMIPVRRPSFAAYVLGLSGVNSLDDFLTKYVVPGAPPAYDPNRLYAGILSGVDNQGANVTINSYYGLIEPGTMSVLEMSVLCRDPKTHETWQQIGIASSRDWATSGFANIGDFVLRIQVEFLTAGAGSIGNGIGGWAGTKSITDFIPYKDAPYGPGAAFPPQMISTVGGPQYESLYQIKLLNGNWWIGHNGYWLGYYPGKLFGVGSSNLLASKACEVDWYGEVYANLNKIFGIWTYTDMGSGRFASEGWPNAAYFRDPSYVSLDAAATWSWPPSDPTITIDIPANLYNPLCYTKSALSSGPAPWEQFFYIGGPGMEPGNQCQGPISPP